MLVVLLKVLVSEEMITFKTTGPQMQGSPALDRKVPGWAWVWQPRPYPRNGGWDERKRSKATFPPQEVYLTAHLHFIFPCNLFRNTHSKLAFADKKYVSKR